MKKRLEVNYHQYKHLLPSRLLYSPNYFRLKTVVVSDALDGHKVIEQRLRHILLTAVRHVPAYQGMSIRTKAILNEPPLELLREFPYLEKDQLMDAPQRYIRRNARLFLAKYATSGGTTGRGVGVWRPKAASDIEKLFFDVRWGAVGYRGVRSWVLRLAAEGIRKSDQTPVTALGRTTFLSPYHIGSRYIAAIVEQLNHRRFDFIHAYASVFFELTYLLQAYVPSRPWSVKAIFLGSEPVTIQQLQFLDAYWQCPIITHYGLNERTNLGFYRYVPGDQEITYRLEPLYSINENYQGTHEIVGTNLWNDLMPIIRYRTKDHGLIVDGNIKRLEGREQNFLVDRYGGKISGMSVVIDECTWGQVRQYQIRQRQIGKIELCIVPRFGGLSPEFQDYILQQQLQRWGGFFDISLTLCESLPLTRSGKTRHIDVQLASPPQPF